MPKREKEVRICKQPGCENRLSRYNPGDSCFAHDSPYDYEGINAYSHRLNQEIKQERKLRNS